MNRKPIIVCLLMSLAMACGKDKEPDPEPEPVQAPGKAVLLFPEKDGICIEGRVVSATRSALVFKWRMADHTERYELKLKNLLSKTETTQQTTGTELELTLDRNTPYSWTIVSTSSKTTQTGQSEVWKFYNSGPGITSHAPYPAEAAAPADRATVTAVNGKVTLSWKGSDADNDITAYDVYFGTATTPPLLRELVTTTSLADVAVTAGNTYYWRVVTRDQSGNRSSSDIFHFIIP